MLTFKTEQQRVEFMDPALVDYRLVGVVHALASFVGHTFGKDVVITSVARYTGRTDSPHYISPDNPRSRAVDIRCHHGYFTPDEIAAIGRFLRIHFPRSDMHALEASIPGWTGCMRHHGQGDNEHIHVAVEELFALHHALFINVPKDIRPDA